MAMGLPMDILTELSHEWLTEDLSEVLASAEKELDT